MTLKSILKKPLTIAAAVILLIVISTFTFFKAREYQASKRLTIETVDETSDTAKTGTAAENKKPSAAKRFREAPPPEVDKLIEGVIVSRELVPVSEKGKKKNTYYLYVRETTGNLRRLGTFKAHYDRLKNGDRIFYKYTSEKSYKLVNFTR